MAALGIRTGFLGMANMVHYPMVIGSSLVEHGRTPLVNPATGEVLSQLLSHFQVFATAAEGTRADVETAVKVA